MLLTFISLGSKSGQEFIGRAAINIKKIRPTPGVSI